MRVRALALCLGRHAARVLHPVKPEQAMAMYAELEHLDGWRALGWAGGCVAAAYRQRASVVAMAVVSARLCVALAAGAFGLLHVVLSISSLWLKLAMMLGASLDHVSPARLRLIAAGPVEHWLVVVGVLGALGVLHMAAAVTLAVGRNDRVCRYAIALVIFEVVIGVFGLPGMTLPTIYVGLALMMALASSGLAWLWLWDERRMARA